MDLDLETFLTALYVIVDDLYQSRIQPKMPARGGPQAEMNDSEVLCLGVAAQWRSGVPWKTERGILRYVHKHLRHLFPTLLSQSAFNRRLRRLWGACILIQDAVAEQLGRTEELDVMDGFPIPIARGARHVFVRARGRCGSHGPSNRSHLVDSPVAPLSCSWG